MSGNHRQMSSDFWGGKRVFVTGHTGFKGSWLLLWLHQMGARVSGYSLDPATRPALFEEARLGDCLERDHRADLANREALRAALKESQAEVVFHLAAQPLVRESYADPIGTFATNVLGTAHLLEAVRGLDSVRVVVVITTDKVYHNQEWAYPYRETDALGGHDPYSASKAAAELITASYRASFLEAQGVRVASARAGNVIGGGDWSADRLVPDCLRAFAAGQPVRLRFPQAVRPWQHVLEPLAGYLTLAERLWAGPGLECGWNFGPEEHATVGEVAQRLGALWGEGARVELEGDVTRPHEAGLLRLDVSRARAELGWRPRWSLEQALRATLDWQRHYLAGGDVRQFSLDQIAQMAGAPG